MKVVQLCQCFVSFSGFKKIEKNVMSTFSKNKGNLVFMDIL